MFLPVMLPVRLNETVQKENHRWPLSPHPGSNKAVTFLGKRQPSNLWRLKLGSLCSSTSLVSGKYRKSPGDVGSFQPVFKAGKYDWLLSMAFRKVL